MIRLAQKLNEYHSSEVEYGRVTAQEQVSVLGHQTESQSKANATIFLTN